MPSSTTSFRDHAPPVGPEPVFFPPKLEETRLKNGLRVLTARAGGATVALRLVFKGSASFPNRSNGAVACVARGLFGGTTNHDGHAVRRVFEDALADWDVDAGPDDVAIVMRGVRGEHLAAAIDMVAEVVQHPLLTAEHLAFQLKPLAESARRWKDSAPSVATITLERALYGMDHPFAQPFAAGFENNASIDPSTARQIHEAVFRPSAATLLLVGAVDDELLAHVTKVYEAWSVKAPASSAPVPALSTKAHPRIVVVPRAGTQAQVAFGALGPARDASDWPALLVAHELLGARTKSRLSRALNDTQGITWGARTQLYNHTNASLLFLLASASTSRTRDVLVEVDRQLGDLRASDVSSSELEETKVMYLRTMPKWFETTNDMAETFSAIPIYGLPIVAFDQMFAAVHSVDPPDLRRLASRYFAPEKLCAVVVGDWAALKPSLLSLGWGPIELRDESGKLLRTE